MTNIIRWFNVNNDINTAEINILAVFTYAITLTTFLLSVYMVVVL